MADGNYFLMSASSFHNVDQKGHHSLLILGIHKAPINYVADLSLNINHKVRLSVGEIMAFPLLKREMDH